MGTQGEGEEAQVVCHQVNLDVDHLAGPVAPRYGPRGKAAPRHVILRATKVVPAQSAPPAVNGVELGFEASTVELHVVIVLKRKRGHQYLYLAITAICFYLGQVAVRSVDSYGGSTGGLLPDAMMGCLPGSFQHQKHQH